VSKRWVLITIRLGFVIIYLNESSERNMIEDFISNDGNNFINDTSENCLQAKHRQNFDIHIN
jgi:hypothetical protein